MAMRGVGSARLAYQEPLAPRGATARPDVRMSNESPPISQWLLSLLPAWLRDCMEPPQRDRDLPRFSHVHTLPDPGTFPQDPADPKWDELIGLSSIDAAVIDRLAAMSPTDVGRLVQACLHSPQRQLQLASQLSAMTRKIGIGTPQGTTATLQQHLNRVLDALMAAVASGTPVHDSLVPCFEARVERHILQHGYLLPEHQHHQSLYCQLLLRPTTGREAWNAVAGDQVAATAKECLASASRQACVAKALNLTDPFGLGGRLTNDALLDAMIQEHREHPGKPILPDLAVHLGRRLQRTAADDLASNDPARREAVLTLGGLDAGLFRHNPLGMRRWCDLLKDHLADTYTPEHHAHLLLRSVHTNDFILAASWHPDARDAWITFANAVGRQ